MRRGAIAVAWMCALVACEPGVSLGAGCTLNSECAAPYVCGAGRCRIQCVEARDCDLPFECLMVTETAGVCSFEPDRDCAGACLAPLECVSGVCRQACDLAAQCAIGMTCVGQVCERPTVTSAVCEPIGDDGCAAEETCAVVDTGGTLRCERLEERGETVAGGACTADADCAPGYVCPTNETTSTAITGRSERLCLRVCAVSPESSCGPGSFCRAPIGRVNGRANVQLPDGLGTCTERCDLLTSEGCPVGEQCTVGDFDATHIGAYCRTIDTRLVPFTACMGSYQCPAGTECQPGLGADSVRSCRPFCDPDDAATCPAGSECLGHGTLTDGTTIALCSTP